MHPYLRLHIIAQPVGRTTATLQGPRAIHTSTSGTAARRPTPSPLVRRVLGKALVDLFCPYGTPRCQPGNVPGKPKPLDHCDLAATCPYGVLFAASASDRPPFALYVLPNRGPDLNLELTLYGPAWRLYPWALSGLQRACQLGLGKTRQTWEIRQVLRVQDDRRRINLCDGDFTRLPPTLEPDHLSLTAGRHLAPRPIEVRLLSPTRLVRDGRLLPRRLPIPFEILVARSLDRFQSLYGDAASDLLRRPIRKAIESDAARVPLIRDRTRWIEVKDYSARNGKELRLGGKVGSLFYGEEAARFVPILRAGEALHIGKNAASGCGRIRVDLATRAAPSTAG